MVPGNCESAGCWGPKSQCYLHWPCLSSDTLAPLTRNPVSISCPVITPLSSTPTEPSHLYPQVTSHPEWAGPLPRFCVFSPAQTMVKDGSQEDQLARLGSRGWGEACFRWKEGSPVQGDGHAAKGRRRPAGRVGLVKKPDRCRFWGCGCRVRVCPKAPPALALGILPISCGLRGHARPVAPGAASVPASGVWVPPVNTPAASTR